MQQAADALGISRPSYSNFEGGQKELTLTEAMNLAELLGVSLESFVRGHIPNNPKYREMTLEFLACAGRKIPKTKLAKMLYLADFAWFYDHLESMSGMTYRKMDYGPVPVEYFSVIEGLFEDGVITEDQETYAGAKLIELAPTARRRGASLLTGEEKALIRKIEKKWRKAKTKEIVHFTHNQLPYMLAQKDGIISYALITQEEPGTIF